jgi:exodeoxyribonuclease VII large subunit
MFQAVMQGDEAASSITSAMEQIFESESEFDCVALIRGGGSKADLESFNHYELAYFITQFPLPVLTGIGHERDESVADMVAHHALLTPTGVAEFLVDQLLAFEFRLSEYLDRLSAVVKNRVQRDLSRLERYQGDMIHLSKSMLQMESEAMLRSEERLRRELALFMDKSRDYLSVLEKRNELVDPRNILKRGYSITMREGRAISSTLGLLAGDILETRLYKGHIISKVEQSTHKDDKRKD